MKLAKLSSTEKLELTLHILLLIYYKIIVLFLPYKFYKSYFRLGVPELISKGIPELTPPQKKELDLLITTHNRVKRLIPWKRSFCLVNALAISHRSKQKNIPHTFILGVKIDPDGLKAHAWITAGTTKVVGVNESIGYKVIGIFIKRAVRNTYTPYFFKTRLGKFFSKVVLRKTNNLLCLPTYLQRKAIRIALNFPRNTEEDVSVLDKLAQEPSSKGVRSILVHLETDHAIKEKVAQAKKIIHIKNLSILGNFKLINNVFSTAEIPMILLKGFAMTLRFYKDFSAREMADLDVFIPSSKLQMALAALAKKEITPLLKKGTPEQHFQKAHSLSLRKSAQIGLDLHLSLFGDQVGCHDFNEIKFQDIHWNGISTKIPSDELLLLMCFAHGIEYKQSRDFKWLIDAATIIRHTEQTLNWEDLIKLARRFQKSPDLRHGLTILKLTTKQSIPNWVLSELRTYNQNKWVQQWMRVHLLPSTKIRTFLMKIIISQLRKQSL